MNALLDQAVLSRVVTAQAERDPDRLVFVFENGDHPAERVTAAALARGGNQIAAELQRAGLARGDRVAIMLRNHPEFVYGLVANAKLGLPTVPIDPRARDDNLASLLSFAASSAVLVADYVVADPAAVDVIRASGARVWVLSTPEGRAAGLDIGREWPTLNEVLAGSGAGEVGEHVTDLGTPWLVASTSRITHDQVLFSRLLPEFFGYRGDDVPYTGVSLAHGNALMGTMFPALRGDVDHAVFSRSFTKTRLWEVCIDHGCTTWSNAGGIATALYSQPSSDKDRAHPVRLVISAGMPREIWRAFEERFGVKVLEWYGTMEGGFAYNPVGVGPVGSFGKPPEGLVEMDVVDGDDRPVGPGDIGELVVRPAGGDAWRFTGDMVTRDEDGWLYFAHRKKEFQCRTTSAASGASSLRSSPARS
jgi:crotonobetaine/carnitine-CoA ligase